MPTLIIIFILILNGMHTRHWHRWLHVFLSFAFWRHGSPGWPWTPDLLPPFSKYWDERWVPLGAWLNGCLKPSTVTFFTPSVPMPPLTIIGRILSILFHIVHIVLNMLKQIPGMCHFIYNVYASPSPFFSAVQGNPIQTEQAPQHCYHVSILLVHLFDTTILINSFGPSLPQAPAPKGITGLW